jgi:hypothetical protein
MATSTISASIEQFCSYFERQLKVISHIDVDPKTASDIQDYQIRFYRKALLVGGLDTLAGVRYSKSTHPKLARQNRERFVRFVREYSEWPEGELVSVPFLKDGLPRAGASKSRLYDHLETKIKKLESNIAGFLPISQVDELIDGLIILAASEKEEEAIGEYEHFALLYRYRNYLVHEWREPGSSMEINSFATEPYYHGYVDDQKLYLVYPYQLFIDLFSRSLKNFRVYLEQNSINPYAVLDDTSRW